MQLTETKKFGKTFFYPDCEFSRRLCKLMRYKYIPKDRLLDLHAMGWGAEIKMHDLLEPMPLDKYLIACGLIDPA